MRDYAALAAGYDGLMEDGKYLARAAYLAQLLEGSPIPVRHILDLGCGTGTIACLLCQRGFRVTATDLSEEMLTQAARKAEGLSRPPLLLHQPMHRLKLLEPADAAVSTLDALNYLTREGELRQTLERVLACLRPGGLFLFDVNTPWKFQRMDMQLYTRETEDTFCVWRTFFSPKRRICTYQVDIFYQKPEGVWRRGYEQHRQRAWSREEWTALLRQSGFENVAVTGDLSRRSAREREDRWMIRCQKPMG